MSRESLLILRLVDDQGTHWKLLQFVAAVEKAEFDEERNFLNLCAEFLDEGSSGGGCAAGGEEIVNEKDAAAGFESIDVYGDGGSAVFEIVLFFVSLVREFAFLSDWNEAGIEFNGSGGGENESACVDSDDGIDAARFDVLSEEINATGEEARVGEDGSDVFELDPRFGEVGDVANGAFDF
jgi:hypothetical protein